MSKKIKVKTFDEDDIVIDDWETIATIMGNENDMLSQRIKKLENEIEHNKIELKDYEELKNEMRGGYVIIGEDLNTFRFKGQKLEEDEFELFKETIKNKYCYVITGKNLVRKSTRCL